MSGVTGKNGELQIREFMGNCPCCESAAKRILRSARNYIWNADIDASELLLTCELAIGGVQ